LSVVEYAVLDSPVSEQMFMFRKNVEDFLRNYSRKLWKVPEEESLKVLEEVWTRAISRKENLSEVPSVVRKRQR
jgi:hypothetical protein